MKNKILFILFALIMLSLESVCLAIHVETEEMIYSNKCTFSGAVDVATLQSKSITNNGTYFSSIGTYTATNPTFNLSTNQTFIWFPDTSNANMICTVVDTPSGYAMSGMFYLINTNYSTITWPTNVSWYTSGTRTTNAPTLREYNRIVIDCFNEVITFGLVSTNATVVP